MQVPDRFQTFLNRRCAQVLCRSPRPFAAAYESDFEPPPDAFAEFGRANRGTSLLLQVEYEHETPELAERLAGAVKRFFGEVPDARAVELCNSPGECTALGSRGVEVRAVHQNCFLDERRYRPMAARKRPYDAAYVARLTHCKRHELKPPELASRLLLLECTIWLSQTKCGLVLSAREGSSFCSSEYLLSDLPVVDTPSIGGRNVVMPDEYVRRVEPAPEAIAEGIAHWAAHRPDPWKVRAAFLGKMSSHREKYRQPMKEITGSDCGRPPHRLGLRPPHPGVACTLAIQAYLFAKGLAAR